MSKALRVLQWLFLALCGFLVLIFTVGDWLIDWGLMENGGAMAGLMTVLALTALLWVPIGLITGFLSLYIDRATLRGIHGWLRHPATYVLTILLGLLLLIFS